MSNLTSAKKRNHLSPLNGRPKVDLYQFIVQEGMPPKVKYYSVSPPVYVRNSDGALVPANRNQTKEAAKRFLAQQGKKVNFAKMVHVRKFDTRFTDAI